MENSTKVFLYAGKERCEVLYFLVKMLEKANKTILIIDNSKLNDFYQIFAHEHDSGEIRKNKLVITKNVIVTNELLDKPQMAYFNYIFIYTGLNHLKNEYEIDSLIVSPGYEPWEIKKVKNIISDFEVDNQEIILVPRDKTSNKILDKDLLIKLGLAPGTYIYPIEFDDRLYNLYISLIYNKDMTKLPISKNVTPGLYSLLSDFAGKYEEMTPKEIKALLK